MINPNKIEEKARKKYPDFLSATVTGEAFFPFSLPRGKLPADYATLNREVPALLAQSKHKRGYGYTVELRSRNHRQYGQQSLPDKIYIESDRDYLKLLKKEKEFSQFKQDTALIRSELPELNSWIANHPLSIVKHSGQWPSLIKVCQYFQQNPKPNLYIRELPVQVHTKFVEQNKPILRSLLEKILPKYQLDELASSKDYGFEQQFSLKYPESLIRLRTLDPDLKSKHSFPASDLSLSVSDFNQLQLAPSPCIIAENIMTFLTLPYVQSGFAIFGSGYAVNRLKNANWLQQCPIFYWGDMDVDGFKILSQMRSHFNHTQSVMMDRATFDQFQSFAVSVSARIETLAYLTPAEQELYAYLVFQHKRLEQERIDQAYVNQYFQHL